MMPQPPAQRAAAAAAAEAIQQGTSPGNQPLVPAANVTTPDLTTDVTMRDVTTPDVAMHDATNPVLPVPLPHPIPPAQHAHIPVKSAPFHPCLCPCLTSSHLPNMHTFLSSLPLSYLPCLRPDSLLTCHQPLCHPILLTCSELRNVLF